MLITLTPGSTARRKEVAPQIQEVAPTTCVMWHFAPCGTLLWELIQEIAPQIQEVAPTDSRGGPHHMCGLALCSVWHFALCGEWILEVAPHGFKRWPPPHVWCGTLLRVALSSTKDPPDASMIVGYILVIPTPGMLCRMPVWLCY